MNIDHEYEWEPVPGLPERLPNGERILWQGAPRWGALARRAFHVRKVALWFGLILAWVLTADALTGAPLKESVLGAAWLVLLGAVAIGLLVLLARAMARSTLYTITNRRVVMRFGVAIPLTINLPFTQIVSADLREFGDGTGDLPLTLVGAARVPYLVLWPNVRPWHFVPAQPMLRAVPQAAGMAKTLAEALAAVAPAANDADGGEADRARSKSVAAPA